MTKTTGKRAMVELLRREGVEYVFGIPGATEIHFMDALEDAPEIRYILGLHEVVCAGMAEGYARATGKPGFLNLHTAPGLAAATPMLYNAQTGGVPLVVTAGQNDSRLLQRDPHLTGDIVGIGRPFCKWSTELIHAEDLPTAIRRAFKMAMQPPKGPVLVSVPQDVLAREFDFEDQPNTVAYPEVAARCGRDSPGSGDPHGRRAPASPGGERSGPRRRPRRGGQVRGVDRLSRVPALDGRRELPHAPSPVSR